MVKPSRLYSTVKTDVTLLMHFIVRAQKITPIPVNVNSICSACTSLELIYNNFDALSESVHCMQSMAASSLLI